jgi:hypothetical protein
MSISLISPYFGVLNRNAGRLVDERANTGGLDRKQGLSELQELTRVAYI